MARARRSARSRQKPPEGTLEERFLAGWRQYFPQLPEPAQQHEVLNPKTNHYWRLDFAWLPEMVLVEIQGWGRHTRLPGQAKDYERQNYLTSLGWRCLFLNSINLSDMEESVTTVAMVLCRARDIIE